MSPDCDAFATLLLDGATPASNRALGEHVHGCLDCFRLMTDLRSLPRIRAALLGETPADPGDQFWNAFGASVMDGVDRERTAPASAVLTRAGLSRPGALERFAGWFRRPLPAALAGACAAAALVAVLAGRPPRNRVVYVAAPPADVELPANDLGDLDAVELQNLLAGMARDESEVELFVAAMHDEDPSLTPVQRLEYMDAEALGALRSAL